MSSSYANYQNSGGIDRQQLVNTLRSTSPITPHYAPTTVTTTSGYQQPSLSPSPSQSYFQQQYGNVQSQNGTSGSSSGGGVSYVRPYTPTTTTSTATTTSTTVTGNTLTTPSPYQPRQQYIPSPQTLKPQSPFVHEGATANTTATNTTGGGGTAQYDTVQRLYVPSPQPTLQAQPSIITTVPSPLTQPQQPQQQQQQHSSTTTSTTTTSNNYSGQGSLVMSHDQRTHSPLPNFKNLDLYNFEKIRLLGRGDIGKVYLVHIIGSPFDRDLFAMKVLDKEEMIQRNKVERIVTENDILSTTRNPFIVTLYSSFQDEDRVYLILEYCAGGEFFQTLRRQPNHSLSEEDARFYACEVLLALEYLHHIGVAYRDLKPENILLHESGHIRLADFDLSKRASTGELEDEPLPATTTSQEQQQQQRFLQPSQPTAATSSSAVPAQSSQAPTQQPQAQPSSKRRYFRRLFSKKTKNEASTGQQQPLEHHHHFAHYHGNNNTTTTSSSSSSSYKKAASTQDLPKLHVGSKQQSQQPQQSQSSKPAKKRLAKMNSFVGTAEYIAPEVISGMGYFPSVDWWTFGILLYEMLYGRTPFRGKDQNETFHNIRHREVQFPTPPNGRPLSAACQSLIFLLLNPDYQTRLGSKYGAHEIKSHPWFAGVDWNSILQQRPPIVPQVKGPLDLSNFEFISDDDSSSDGDEEVRVEKLYSVDENLDQLESRLMATPMRPKHRRSASENDRIKLIRTITYRPSTPTTQQ